MVRRGRRRGACASRDDTGHRTDPCTVRPAQVRRDRLQYRFHARTAPGKPDAQAEGSGGGPSGDVDDVRRAAGSRFGAPVGRDDIAEAEQVARDRRSAAARRVHHRGVAGRAGQMPNGRRRCRSALSVTGCPGAIGISGLTASHRQNATVIPREPALILRPGESTYPCRIQDLLPHPDGDGETG